VYLVDTPGFDDTDCKGTDTLKEIATWLTEEMKMAIQTEMVDSGKNLVKLQLARSCRASFKKSERKCSKKWKKGSWR
jgi:hypothetical protein